MLKIKLLTVGLLLSAFSCTGVFAENAKCDDSKVAVEGEKLVVKSGSVDLVSYQKQPMSNPKGGDKFAGSNFIHPLKTPSGFCLTDLQPGDHLHHFGLWWPWKYLKAEGRKVLYWERQKGEGVIKAQGASKTDCKNGACFTAESHYIDKTAPSGPKVILKETLKAKVSALVKSPAKGYFLDMTITQTPAIDSEVEVVKYRYSGFSIRGSEKWDKDNSKLLTSEGKDRQHSNFTKANWALAEGDTGSGKKAGFIMMSHPENPNTPQLLRTWNNRMHNGATFANFNPVQKEPLIYKPGKKYTQKYRLFVYDGKVTKSQADKLWKDYKAGCSASANKGVIPLPIELPPAVFTGTPTNLKVENLEKPLGKPRPTFFVPAGTKNVALGKKVTSSDSFPIIGELPQITDGDARATDGSWVELGPFEQHVTIDLGAPHELSAILLWHFHKQPRVYFDVVVQTADDPDFVTNVKTLFNNDIDNSLGLGTGTDKHYIDTSEGKLIDAKGTKARFVRMYSNGNNQNDMNHYIEASIFGRPVN